MKIFVPQLWEKWAVPEYILNSYLRINLRLLGSHRIVTRVEHPRYASQTLLSRGTQHPHQTSCQSWCACRAAPMSEHPLIEMKAHRLWVRRIGRVLSTQDMHLSLRHSFHADPAPHLDLSEFHMFVLRGTNGHPNRSIFWWYHGVWGTRVDYTLDRHEESP